jgi:hypothetical protein
MTRLLVLFILIILLSACPAQKQVMESPQNSVLESIYSKVSGGQIEICLLGNDSVYTASINAYDAPTDIYSYQGKVIGTCNYAFNLVDSICYNLQNCRTVYRGINHINGEPFIDLYNLEKKH